MILKFHKISIEKISIVNIYMSLSFKLSFDLSDFEDDEFLHDLKKVYKFYDNVIELEYKLFKEKVIKQFATLEEVFETIKENNIQFGNLIFYNFDIPAIKKKLKERNL
jgi:hypothetical protein